MRAILNLLLPTFTVVCLLSSRVGAKRVLPLPKEKMVQALLRGDTAALRRIGEQIGPQRLETLISSPNRRVAIAAIVSVSRMERAWIFLPALAKAAAHPDHSIAAKAAEIAEDLSSALSPMELQENEIPQHQLSQWQGAWLVVAAETSRWADIRVLSLETAIHLKRLQRGPSSPKINWDKFLEDKHPAMRAALLSHLPRAERFQDIVLHKLHGDESISVAMRAGQWLCGPLGSPMSSSLVMDETTVGRILTLAADRSIAVSRRADLVPCLIANDVRGKQALRMLLQQSPPALRKAILEQTKQP